MAQRLLSSLISLILLSIVSFAALELAPGDPATLLLGAAGKDMPPETLARMKSMYRFDRPPLERYGAWLKSTLTGNLGVSLKTNRPVMTEFLVRIPISASIAAGALLFAAVLGLMLGVFSVLHEGGFIDHALRFLTVASTSVPVFIIGLFLLYVFSFLFGWFPLYGVEGGSGLVLPIVTLGGVTGVSLGRIIRNSLLGAIHEEYFLAALGKGLSYRRAVISHALRNALTPSVTYLALRFAGLIGGIVLIETVFSLPGMGSYIFEAIVSRDYPVIQGYIVFFGSVVIVMNLLADVLIRFIDPRPTQGRLT